MQKRRKRQLTTTSMFVQQDAVVVACKTSFCINAEEKIEAGHSNDVFIA